MSRTVASKVSNNLKGQFVSLMLTIYKLLQVYLGSLVIHIFINYNPMQNAADY